YYACRDGESEHTASDTVLTRPEGNGWITRALVQRMGPRLHTGALVHRLADTGRSMEIDVFLPDQQRSLRVVAQQAIWAAPLFLLATVGSGLPPEFVAAARGATYAPWLVANLTLTEMPIECGGAQLAWDNVLYDSPALGYVVATHQQIRVRPGPTVLTYYRALSGEPPAQARQQLLKTSREAWSEHILTDLERPHPGIRALTTRLDVFRNGHAMVRPVPGTIWGEARQRLAAGLPRLHLAHADASGLSLFEEANYRGVLAAQRVLQRLGAGPGRSLV
ncbi:MAG: twin-arginine translocation pathway signal protein, partial [Rhodocyclaceae bacterium]